MDSKSMYIIMQNVIQTHDFSYFYMQRLHRFTCVDLQSWQGGFLQITITPSHVLKYESNYRLQTGLYQDGWIKYPRFLLQTLPSLSLFLQCSYSPSTSSVFHYLLTSLLFPPYLFNLFFPFSSVCVFEVPACRQSTRVTLSLQNVLAASPNHRIFRNCIGEYGYETCVSSIMEEKPIY